MSKRIIGVTYEDGICTGITVDGILDDKTAPEEAVYFKRIVHGQWLPDVKFGTDVMAGNTICSVCGKGAWSQPSYCPHCGATMKMSKGEYYGNNKIQ